MAFTQSRIFPVLLVNFIGMLGYSLIIPILVFLVQDFGGNEFIYGVLGSIYPAFQLIGATLLFIISLLSIKLLVNKTSLSG